MIPSKLLQVFTFDWGSVIYFSITLFDYYSLVKTHNFTCHISFIFNTDSFKNNENYQLYFIYVFCKNMTTGINLPQGPLCQRLSVFHTSLHLFP